MFSLFWFKLFFLNLPSPSLFSFYNLILYLSRFYFNFKCPFELLLRLLQRVIYNSWLLLNLLLQNDYSLGFTSTFDPQQLCVFLPKESETVLLHFVFESTFFVLELFNLSNSHNNQLTILPKISPFILFSYIMKSTIMMQFLASSISRT